MLKLNNAAQSGAAQLGAAAPDPSPEHALDMVAWASEMSDKLARLQMFGLAAKKINDQQ